MARVTLTPVPMTRMTHTSAPTPITRVTPTPTPEPTARTTPTLSPTPTTRCCAWGHHTTDKDFTRERPLEQVVELICQESTAHGVGHTWNNRRNFLGVFWFIVTASLFILLLLLSARLSCDFVQRDVQSQTTVKLARRGQLQLPSVALCNRHFFSKWKLRALNISTRLANYLIAITGSIFVVRKEFLVTSEGQAFLRDSHSQLLSLMLAHNFTHSQLIDAISYRCEEMVLQCGVGTHKLDTAECCNLIVATPTMTGKCYTFFGAANHTQTMEGDHLGVTIYINFTQDDQPEIDPVILDMPKFMKAGFQMTMMSNHTHPSYMVVGQSVPLLPRMYTGVEVYLTVVRDVGMKTALDWSETECIPLNKMNYRLDPEAFLNTEPNCDVGASGYCSKHICNCTIYGLDNSHDSWAPCPLNMNFQCFGIILDAMNVTRQYYNSSILQNEKKLNRNLIYQCWNKVSKGCRRLCSHYYYMHASTHLPIQDYIYQSLHDQFSLHNGSDVAVAMVYFPNLHYTEIKRWRKDIEEFMSELGGYMGLFLGCSFVTLIEIFVFFALIFAVFVRQINVKLSNSIHPSSSKSPSHEMK